MTKATRPRPGDPRRRGGGFRAPPDLVGMAGFDSESGPGIGQAIKEARKTGQIIGTCVDAEEPHLRLLSEGALTACIGQKRELFTYCGLKILFDVPHQPAAPDQERPQSQEECSHSQLHQCRHLHRNPRKP